MPFVAAAESSMSDDTRVNRVRGHCWGAGVGPAVSGVRRAAFREAARRQGLSFP